MLHNYQGHYFLNQFKDNVTVLIIFVQKPEHYKQVFHLENDYGN